MTSNGGNIIKRKDIKKIKKRKKWPWIIAIIGLIIGGLALNVYLDLTSTLKSMYKPIDRELSDKREEVLFLINKIHFQYSFWVLMSEKVIKVARIR